MRVVRYLAFLGCTVSLPLESDRGQVADNKEALRMGKATYYTEWNQNPGSCGYIPPFDNLVALSSHHMPHSCGKCVMVRYGGLQEKAIVTDTCAACDEKWIDLSDNMFSRFEGLDKGVMKVDWEFCDCD